MYFTLQQTASEHIQVLQNPSCLLDFYLCPDPGIVSLPKELLPNHASVHLLFASAFEKLASPVFLPSVSPPAMFPS